MIFSFEGHTSSLATTTQKQNTGTETGYDLKSHTRYESSTLPRKMGGKSESRGTKLYSSARYNTTNTSTVPLPPRRSKLSRHGSFQGGHEGRVLVTPFLQDSRISQDNSDVLENLSHFNTAVFPGNSQESKDSNFFTMMKDQGATSQSDSSDFERSSTRRHKKSNDSNPYSTIPEEARENGESHDQVPPILPVKQRRLSQRNNYTPMKIRNKSSSGTYHFDNGPANQIAADSSDGLGSKATRHSSFRSEQPKKGVALKRGTSLYGVGDSPRRYPRSRYEERYMPSALSPDPSQSADESNPPPGMLLI